MMFRADYVCNVLSFLFPELLSINHFPFMSLLQGIVACFPEINLRIFQTLCPVNVEVISFSCGNFLRAGGNAALFEYNIANGAEFYCRWDQ
jgi:hypothetical protein